MNIKYIFLQPKKEIDDLMKIYPIDEEEKNDEIKEKNVLKPHVLYDDGSVYLGEFNTLDEKRSGRGILLWEDKSKYQGQWDQDKPNGKGKFIYPDGDYYIGDWKNGKVNGKGKFVHLNGSTYEGNWKDNFQDGEGTETWPDGSVYKGNYSRGLKKGKGLFKW